MAMARPSPTRKSNLGGGKLVCNPLDRFLERSPRKALAARIVLQGECEEVCAEKKLAWNPKAGCAADFLGEMARC